MKKLIVLAAPLCLASVASAQVLFTGSYSQNFDSLPSSGTSTWANNSTLLGWYAGTDVTAGMTSLIAGLGTSTTAGFYTFGLAGTNPVTERALGFVTSNSFTGASGTGRNSMGLFLQNTSGGALTNIQVAYRGEEWRQNGNTTAQSITFGYAVNATQTDAGVLAATTTGVGGLTFTSPVTGSTAASLDGNAVGNNAALSATLTGLTLNAGETLLLRWIDVNDSGNDHTLAIDDVSVTADAVPEPGTMTILAAVAGLASFRRKRR